MPAFHCYRCSKCFQSQSSLVRHQNNHTKSTKFVCHVCDVVFRRRDILTRHMKMHKQNSEEEEEIDVDNSINTALEQFEPKHKSNVRVKQITSRKRCHTACKRCQMQKTRCDGQYPCTKCYSVNKPCTYNDGARRTSQMPIFPDPLQTMATYGAYPYDNTPKFCFDPISRPEVGFNVDSCIVKGEDTISSTLCQWDSPSTANTTSLHQFKEDSLHSLPLNDTGTSQFELAKHICTGGLAMLEPCPTPSTSTHISHSMNGSPSISPESFNQSHWMNSSAKTADLLNCPPFIPTSIENWTYGIEFGQVNTPEECEAISITRGKTHGMGDPSPAFSQYQHPCAESDLVGLWSRAISGVSASSDILVNYDTTTGTASFKCFTELWDVRT